MRPTRADRRCVAVEHDRARAGAGELAAGDLDPAVVVLDENSVATHAIKHAVAHRTIFRALDHHRTAAIDAPVRTGGSELITHVTAADGQPQIITVIDPRQRVMAVYHVDRTTGVITPKSVRNITWDLQMIEFNSGSPLPQDIRNGLQR